MNTIIEKLNKLKGTKEAIRIAINNKGGTLTKTDKLSAYATAINKLTISGGNGPVDIVKPIFVEQKDPIPNTGHLEKIFFNTKLEPNQVDALIANANLTFTSEGSISFYPILMTNTGITIAIFDFSSQLGAESGSAWLIADLNSDATYYVSPALASDDPTHAGWIQNSFTSYDTGEITINAELVQEMEGIVIGAQNDLLADLIRIYSLVDSGETEFAKSLTGQYKLVEQNITLDTKDKMTYTYDFVNNINEDTKEITVIKNIEVDPQQEEAIVSRQIATYTNDRFNAIPYYAFGYCRNLKNVSFPNAVRISNHAFYYCDILEHVDIPLADTIDGYAFSYCGMLDIITFPQVTHIYEEAFYRASHLTEANLPKLTYISTKAFSECYELIKIFISQTDSVCSLGNKNAFSYCYHILGETDSIYNPNGLKDGYIYVPASLLSQYKVAKNWTTYATQIIGHEYLEAGTSLPDYTTSSFTTQLWYSDEKLTNVVTYVATSGTYYCKLSA